VRTTVQESPDRFAVVATVGGRHQLWGTAVHDDADRLFDALKVSRRLDFGPQSGNHLRVMSWGDWCKVRVGLGLGEEPEPVPEPVDEENERRAQLVAGLRELAQFYVEHPEMPIPRYPDFTHCVMGNVGDEAGTAEVVAIAAGLGVEVDYGTHVRARRQFAGLPFSAYYVPREVQRRHEAYSSYYGAVEPDGGTDRG